MEHLKEMEHDSNRSNVSLASYEPGKYSDEEIEMYENYKYDMNEHRPGMPIIEIDEFLRLEYGQARAGASFRRTSRNIRGLI